MFFKKKKNIITYSILVSVVALSFFSLITKTIPSLDNQQDTIAPLATSPDSQTFTQMEMTPIGAGFGTLGGKTNTNEVHGGKVNFDNEPIWLVNGEKTSFAFVDLNFDGQYDEIWGWGENSAGTLGNGNETNQNVPMKLDDIWNSTAMLDGGNSKIIYFYNASDTVFAFIDTNDDKIYDEIWGWGENSKGTLGNGDTINQTTPIQLDNTPPWNSDMLANGAKVVDFYAGTNTVFAFIDTQEVDNDLDGQYDEIWGWGSNEKRTLGNGTDVNQTTPMRLDNISAWSSNMLANNARIVDFYNSSETIFAFIDTNGDQIYDEIWEWGNNENGNMGNNSSSKYYSIPFLVSNFWLTDGYPLKYGKAIDFFSSSNVYFLMIDINANGVFDENDDVFGWGKGSEGAIGDGDSNDNYKPLSLIKGYKGIVGHWQRIGMFGSGEKIIGFYSGDSTTFAFIDVNGDGLHDEIWGWGDNLKGTLGSNEQTDYYFTPQNLTAYWTSVGMIDSGAKITNFYNGFDTVFAFVDTDNDSNYNEFDEIWGWGYNENGTLGFGTNDVFLPTQWKKYSSISIGVVDQTITNAKINYDWRTIGVTDVSKIKLEYQLLKTNDSSVVVSWTPVSDPIQNDPSAILELDSLIVNTQYTLQMRTEVQMNSINFTTASDPSVIKIDEIVSTSTGADVYYFWTYNNTVTPNPTIEYRVLLQSTNSEVISWTPVSSPIANNPNTTFNITGLLSNTTYILEMRTEGGEVSKQTSNFITTNQPSTIQITNVSTTGSVATVTYNWSFISSTLNPTLQYQVLDANNQEFIPWTNVPDQSPNNPSAIFEINGLSDNSTYLLQMKTESNIVVSFSFTTTNVNLPSSVTINNITSDTPNSAIVNYYWVYDPSDIITPTLEYQLLDANDNVVTPWIGVLNPTPNNPKATFTINGLAINTTYKLQMRTESGTIVEQSFTTMNVENQFSNIAIGSITPSANSATITYNWTYGQDTTNPTLKYKVTQGSTTTIDWTNVPDQSPNNPNATFTIDGLTANTQYTLQMKTESGNIIEQVFSTTNDYSIINITNVVPTPTTALVTYNWTYDDTKTSNPTLEYKVAQGSTTTINWTNVPTPTPNNPNATFTIDGLTANTQYILQMKTESGLIISYTFTTTDLTSIVTIETITPNTNSAIVTYNWFYDPALTNNPTLEYQVIKTNDSSIVKMWTTFPAIPNNPNATFTIDGLTTNTQYTLQMRTESGSLVTNNFTTTIAPSQVVITNVVPSTNSATINYNWTYDSTIDPSTTTLQYQLLDVNNNVITPWENVPSSIANIPASFTIDQLTDNTTYTIQMKTESETIVENTFTTTTLVEDSVVTIGNVIPDVTTATVTYNWTYNQNALFPKLQYQVLDSNNNVVQVWTDVDNPISNNSTASFIVTNLEPNTQYIVQMRTESNLVVTSPQFTTLSSNTAIIIISVAGTILILVFVPLILSTTSGNGKTKSSSLINKS